MTTPTVALIHDIPTPGHTGGHTVFHRIREVLRRNFPVREWSFARGGPRASAAFYPFFPLARVVAEGYRARCDLVVTNLSGVFPAPADLVYLQPPPAPTDSTTLRQRLGFGRPPLPDLWPKPIEWLWFNRATRGLLDGAAQAALDRTGTLLAVSEAVRRSIHDELGREAIVIRPSLDQAAYDQLPRYARHPRERSIVIVSRIDATKRLDELVAIANACPELPFTLLGRVPLGGGALVEALHRGNVAHNLRILPDAPEALKREMLGRSAVFLQTSRREAFATSVIEAVRAGAFPLLHASAGAGEVLDRENLYDTVEEAATRLRAVLAELRPVSPEARLRMDRVADPHRFEVEFLKAVDLALAARRR